MAKQKKLEKKAAQALEAAEEAVAEAKKAAEKLDAKKAKKRARELEEQLAEAAGRSAAHAGADDAARSGASGVADRGAGLTPPLPSVRDKAVEETVEFAGSASTSAPHDPALDRLTVQALRDAARARGLRNVSHLTKGQLIERLSER